jgi:glycolate oxidase iron-sulfur subunit
MNSSNQSTSLNTPEFKALLNQCIHCGLCLQSCPTYAVFGTEMDSPRGRIALMRAASDGLIELGGKFDNHINLCLMCRACEQACPSGVRYGTLIETTRVVLEKARNQGAIERFIRWLTLRQLMPHQNRLRLIARGMHLYQLLRIQNLVRRLNFLPEALRNIESLLPRISAFRLDYRSFAPAIGERRGKVAFFHGCVQDAFLGDVNTATVRVLQRNGYEVHFPKEQTCCGAAQLHVGEEELFFDLARKNIDSFPAGEYDAIINNAGGCGSTLKEYDHLLKNDPIYAEKAREFSSKVKDINEFLIEHLHVPPKGTIKARVTYSDSCHLRHVQKVINQPRELLRQVPGIELVELNKPDRCCGSAGVYNIVQAETANAILDEKMADIVSTGADTIVTTNTGCHLQLIYGVRRSGLNMRVVHLVELLDQSYEAGN